MSNQKGRYQEYQLRKKNADRRIEEIRTRIEKLLERTRRIEARLARRERELAG